MLKLEYFNEDDFKRLINWMKSKRDLTQFAATLFDFPLTKQQLNQYIKEKYFLPKKIIHIKSGEVIGHCELNYQNEYPRLSRILIWDIKNRDKGFGKLIIQMMIDEILKTDSSTKTVDLRVFGWNKNALKLYQNMGFQIQEKHTFDFKYSSDEIWKNIYMQKQLCI